MAIRGRRPKPPGQAVNRHARVHEWTEVPDVPFTDAPKLPPRGYGRRWPKRTLQKWEAWSTMPHCVLWRPVDWEFAFTALDIAAFMHEGNTKLATELRAWEKVMGVTADARAGQRIRYVEPVEDNAKDDAAVVNLVSYRDL